MGRADRLIVCCAAFAVSYSLLMAHAHGQWELWETDDTFGELGANLQLMTAYVYLGDLGNVAGIGEEAGLGGAVGRLEWHFDLGRRVDVDVHNRFFWQASTVPEEFLFQGFEVTTGDQRRLDTELELTDGDTTRLVHDLDRFVVALYFGAVDLYLGRQAIRWGVSDIFATADRFAPLSPFELDTLQRRGIDAARAITHLTPSLELDFVVADRGEGEPLALGARAEYFGARTDIYGGFGRFWERLSAMGGVSLVAGYWKFFGEGEALWNLDEEEFDLPRFTLGAQRVTMSWQVGAEYHFNGFGVAPGDDYLEALARPEFARGESYLLGRHYAGVNGFYFFEGGWGLGGGAIANLVDPSVIVFPTAQYELEEQFTIAAGAYVGFGEGPTIDFAQEQDTGFGPLSVPSEYGVVSDLYFLQMTAFF